MKRSNLFWVALLMLGACTKKSPELLITLWDKKAAPSERTLLRTLASSQNQCMKDVFTVETLKAEVRELERRFTRGRPVSGRWKHIDLSTLPVAQGNFLKSFGRELGDLTNPQAIDFSSCTDVPCVFNRIYGKGDEVNGYVHYIWYLKFGHLLAADNKVPMQTSMSAGEFNGKAIPFSNYLFDEKELYAFWRLSYMLKAPHTTLRYLTQIQRIPRGELFEGANAGACGLAYSSGFITLTDGCLTFDSYSQDNGWIYQAITHELSHQVDMEEGRGSISGFRSSRQDYVSLSGLAMTEYVDAAGKPQRGWQLAPGAKVVSDYAKTNPTENFAESVAVFRIDGARAKEGLSNDHYGFVSRSYYQNREFTVPALMSSWIQENASEISEAVLKAVADCARPGASGRSQYFRRGDFSTNVTANVLGCISERASQISAELRAKVAITTAQGCDTLATGGNRDSWNALVKDHLKTSFERHLVQGKEDPQYLGRLQEFMQDINNPTLARTAYLTCYQSPNESSCYAEELHKRTLERLGPLGLPEVEAQELLRMYTNAHPYETIREDTVKLYQTFVQDNLEQIRVSAGESWNSCLAISHSDTASPTGRAFTVGDGYLISSFFNCLNAALPEAVLTTIRAFRVDERRVESASEEKFLTAEVRPHFVRIWRQLYDDAKVIEIQTAAQFLQQDQGETRRKLLADLSWVKNVVDSQQILNDCKVQGFKVIGMTLLYNLPATVFGQFIEGVACHNIVSAGEFGAWLDSSQGQLRERAVANLDGLMLEYGHRIADECLRQFPNTNIINRLINRRSRDACFLSRWPIAERSMITETLSNPVIQRLNISRGAIESRLAQNRSALQQRIITEKLR